MLRAMPVVFDPAGAYPEVTALRAALGRRDWAACRAVLDAAPPAGRTMLIRWASEDRGIGDFLRAVLDADPGDSGAAAMLGQHLIDVGWSIRTRARAQHVGREQFVAFHQWLRQAEAVLIDAAARHPEDPALWAARLLSARGLEVGLAESLRRYDRMAAADPHHLPGQAELLQTLCPKWSGTWDLLHGWAREAVLAAPPGSVQGTLVAEAHLEHWADLDEGVASWSYLPSEPVRWSILEAAERTVFHPGFARRDFGWVRAASSFAMVFSLMDDQRSAARMFGLLGELAAPFPWSYLTGDPAANVRARRAKALAAAGSAR